MSDSERKDQLVNTIMDSIREQGITFTRRTVIHCTIEFIPMQRKEFPPPEPLSWLGRFLNWWNP